MADKERTYDPKEIEGRLAGLEGWGYRDGAIRRTYTTDGWRTTMLVVNAIAWACEAADHHPDLLVRWSTVEVALNTHSAKGITDRDFETARLIEQTLRWRPPAGAALSGPSAPLVR